MRILIEIEILGPQASKLEQDFSILMATGRLYSPSLFIPGYTPDAKRKTTISHGPCGSEDPQDKVKNKRKNLAKSSSIKSFSFLEVSFVVYAFYIFM